MRGGAERGLVSRPVRGTLGTASFCVAVDEFFATHNRVQQCVVEGVRVPSGEPALQALLLCIGYVFIEVDILGLPIKELEVDNKSLTANDFFNKKLLLLNITSNDLIFLNIENMKVFRIPKIILYACKAIEHFIFEETETNSEEQKKGPWG